MLGVRCSTFISFFSLIRLAVFSGQTPHSCETTFKANRRISNKKYRMMKVGIALLCHFNKIDRIHSFEIRYSLFDIRYSLFRSFLFVQTGCPLAGGSARVKLHWNVECRMMNDE
ncbi:hypothetical protein D1AOALGA4SA_8135 [Olavius algarvensis Delta 1 endosymbiont]|nr:hypothetical protein D1AOALGA4SA_8135 [Olavius algarvensis Delta 1 endosymbiont]